MDALLDDFHRQGSALTESQIERVIDRRHLGPAEALQVYRELVMLNAVQDSVADGITEVDGKSGDQSSEADGGSVGMDNDDEPATDVLVFLQSMMFDHSLLTEKEEVELARAHNLGKNYESALKAGQIPDDDRTRDLIRRGHEARERVISSNLRLVVKFAMPFLHTSSLDYDDLVQEGIIGLMRAVEKYDYTRGFRFSTYASYWIRQAIQRAIMNLGETIRFPVHIQEKIRLLRRAVRVLYRVNGGRSPTLRELHHELNWPIEQVQFILDVMHMTMVSTEAPMGKDSDLTLQDVIPDGGPSPQEIAEDASEAQAVEDALCMLSEREKEILESRFGIDDHPEQTLEEIGQRFGVTRERIRQIEEKALLRLRGVPELREMDGIDELKKRHTDEDH